MSFGWLVLAFLAATNPARVRQVLPTVDGSERVNLPVVAAGALVTLALAIVLGALGDSILEALDISDASFRLAAGAILSVVGLRVLIQPGPAVEPELRGAFAVIVPVVFPLLFTPELAALAVAATTDASIGAVAGALAIGLAAVVAVAALVRRSTTLWQLLPAFTRVLAVLLVVVGAALLVDSIRDV